MLCVDESVSEKKDTQLLKSNQLLFLEIFYWEESSNLQIVGEKQFKKTIKRAFEQTPNCCSMNSRISLPRNHDLNQRI
jgi:hypothetical protein